MARKLFAYAAIFCFCVILFGCTAGDDKGFAASPQKETHSALAPLKIYGDGFTQVDIKGPNNYSHCLLSPLDTLTINEPDTGLYIIKVSGRAGIGVRINGTDQQYFPISASNVPGDYSYPPYRFHFESVTQNMKKPI